MNQNGDDLLQSLSGRWREGGAELQISAAAIRRRLRRQRLFGVTYIVGEWLVAVVGVMVAVIEFQQLGPGLALPTIGFIAFAMGASTWARHGANTGDMSSVAGMVELTISRARKSLRYVDASYWVCGVAVLLIAFIGIVVGLRLPFEPSHARHVMWLMAAVQVYIVAVAAGCFIYGRRVQSRLDRFLRIQAMLKSA